MAHPQHRELALKMNSAGAQWDSPGQPRAGEFGDTEWHLVHATSDANTSIRRKALGELYLVYWYPIYAYIRRRGSNHHDAQDLAQGFFIQLVERESFKAVAQEKGRFRSFLLAALKHFLANAHAYEKRQKRGGEYQFVSWDDAAVQARYEAESAVHAVPETQFDRDWVSGVLGAAHENLRREYFQAGKTMLFNALEAYLPRGLPAAPYSSLATQLGLSEHAIKMSVVRMRRRFREILREILAATLSRPEDVEEELRYVFSTLNE